MTEAKARKVLTESILAIGGALQDGGTEAMMAIDEIWREAYRLGYSDGQADAKADAMPGELGLRGKT